MCKSWLNVFFVGFQMSLSVHADLLPTNTHTISSHASLCEYLLFYLFFLAPARTWASSQKETTLSWKSSRKPAGQNRPHFSLSPSGIDIFWALLSSLLS